MRIFMSSLGLLAAAAAVAQTDTNSKAATADLPTIGEIVVTAQRREESNLKVGLTLTALSGDAIAQQRVQQVLDLKGRVPNLDIKEQVPGAMPVVTIRGVGLNDFGAANSPSAGVYVDQVYVASIAMMAFDMFDIERIEVLKGPQGTLYGRNSTAGALNIITRKPQQEFDAYATLGYGNYETMDFEGAVNVPLGDTAALRLSGKTIQQGEGYWESRRLPGATIGDRDLTMGRLQLALEPGENFDMNLKVEGTRSRSEMGQPEFFGTVDPLTGGTCAPILAGHIDNTQCTDFLGYTDTDGDPFKGDWAREGVYDIDNTGVTLTMNAGIGAATLTSVTGYVDFDRTFDIDVDATPARELDFVESDDIQQFSQELRLAASGELLDWIVGAFYSKDDVGISIPGGHEDLFLTRTLVTADQDTKSAAGFAHGEWHLADKLDLVTGARYTWEERQYAGGTTDLNPFGASCLLSPTCTPGFVGPAQLTFVDDTIEDRNWSWRAGLEYQPEQAELLYATISRGTKSGGFFSGISTTNLQLAPFEPEELTAYEVGFKRSSGSTYLNVGVLLRLLRHPDFHRGRHRPVHHSEARQRRRGNRLRSRPRSDLGADFPLHFAGKRRLARHRARRVPHAHGRYPQGQEAAERAGSDARRARSLRSGFLRDARRLDSSRRQLFRQRVQGRDQRPDHRGRQLRARERARRDVQCRALVGSGVVGQEPERRAIRRSGAQHRLGRRQSQLQRAANLRSVVHLSVVTPVTSAGT